MAAELLVEDVGIDLGGKRVLDAITLDFAPGRMVAVSGPSGSGKTTLLSVAGGLLRPTTGTVTFAGKPVWTGGGDPRLDVAFVLQVFGLVPILTALENVSIALRARGVRPREADERAAAALDRLRIADVGARQIDELSGGQVQRVACARGIVAEPALLLADEPTSELDQVNRDHVLKELRAEAERGAVVVVATHDEAVVQVCDREYHLVEGSLAQKPAVPGVHRASDWAR